jgi:hypothetical protein
VTVIRFQRGDGTFEADAARTYAAAKDGADVFATMTARGVAVGGVDGGGALDLMASENAGQRRLRFRTVDGRSVIAVLSQRKDGFRTTDARLLREACLRLAGSV